MRKISLLLTLITLGARVFGQVDYSAIAVDYGDHDVGFYHTTLLDPSRSYYAIDQLSASSARPIHVSIWHPTDSIEESSAITVKDYLKILQIEEEYPNLPFSYFYDWFYIQDTEMNR